MPKIFIWSASYSTKWQPINNSYTAFTTRITLYNLFQRLDPHLYPTQIGVNIANVLSMVSEHLHMNYVPYTLFAWEISNSLFRIFYSTKLANTNTPGLYTHQQIVKWRKVQVTPVENCTAFMKCRISPCRTDIDLADWIGLLLPTDVTWHLCRWWKCSSCQS